MGYLRILCLVLLCSLLNVSAQEITCENALCAPVAACEGNTGDCPIYEFEDPGFGCCPSCCPTTCVQCFVDPCDDYYCESNPDLECEANYCGGCNRIWYSPDLFGYTSCDKEARISEQDDDDLFTTVDDSDVSTGFSSHDSADDGDSDDDSSRNNGSSSSASKQTFTCFLAFLLCAFLI